jgi:hypothetical protein
MCSGLLSTFSLFIFDWGLVLLFMLQRSFLCFYEMAESSWEYFVLLTNLVNFLLLIVPSFTCYYIFSLMSENIKIYCVQPMLFLKVHVKELLLATFIATSTWVYM